MKNIEILLKEFNKTRNKTHIICEPLENEDYVIQPRIEVSPPKWHLAHTTWFFEEMILKKFDPSYEEFNRNYSLLFNSYYKSVGEHWQQGERGVLSRPSVKSIYDYRNYVDEHLNSYLIKDDVNQGILEILELGIHHEKQHQELLVMDIKAILATNIDYPIYHKDSPKDHHSKEMSYIKLEEGLKEIGSLGAEFSYDNECPRHKSYIHSTLIQDQLVTNGEYLEFVNSGGYENSTLWLSKGHDWVSHNQVTCPLYWLKKDNDWYEFDLYGLRPLDLNAPVKHISYFEANAYAKYKNHRLPTEQELEIFFSNTEVPNELWNWSSSHYSPYPGFRELEAPLGEYNGKFMCNQFVLRGGCIATPENHLRATYRNFYEPHQRWMFSGIRLAKDNL